MEDLQGEAACHEGHQGDGRQGAGQGVLQAANIDGLAGLESRSQSDLKTIGFPDICKEEVEKEEIKEAIFDHHYKYLKEEVAAYEKLNCIKNEDLRTAQPYMKENCLEYCRMAFRLRTRQFVCRANMSKMYCGVLWCHNCSQSADQGPDGGPAPVETQQHLEICKAFRHLRKGRDVENNFSDKVLHGCDGGADQAEVK